jgi:hypothetical protein
MSFRNVISDKGSKFRTGLDKISPSNTSVVIDSNVGNNSVRLFRSGLGKSQSVTTVDQSIIEIVRPQLFRNGLGKSSPVVTTTTQPVIEVVRPQLFRTGLGKRDGGGAIADPLESLKTNLISYWNLDESSGTRNDSFGTNHLTLSGTVDNKFNGANFNNSPSNRLAKTSNSDLQINGSSFTVCCWAWLRSKTSYRGFITKDDISSGREFNIAYIASEGAILDKIVFNVFNLAVGTGGASAIASTFGSPPTEQWIFVVGQYDSVNNLAYISANNGAKNSVSTAGISVGAGNADFTIGSWSGGVFSLTNDGGVKQAGLWKRLLTDDEITLLYNNGLGRKYIGSSFV